MRPALHLAGLEKSRPWEYAVRFLFGGLVTACAGLVTHRWGPVVGGLLLGFPAILPASLTLVKRHDGRAKAVDDARGGALGSVGLVAFGAVVWLTAEQWPSALSLLVASLAWTLVAAGLWALRFGR
ncbi:MAG TPA: DUF3147 family protein [Polyangiaceae bacterium]|jgi:hypothetical protein|nr:DUF3147 family protein [Polyangiaceae bacterium]